MQFRWDFYPIIQVHSTDIFVIGAKKKKKKKTNMARWQPPPYLPLNLTDYATRTPR